MGPAPAADVSAQATDFFAYTPAEWEEMVEASLFVQSIAREGIVLYAKEEP